METVVAPNTTINDITLSNAEMLFYEKNIIHDIIHDYGFFAAVSRWTKNRKYVSQFLPGGYSLVIPTDAPEEGDEGDEGDEGEQSGGMKKMSSKRMKFEPNITPIEEERELTEGESTQGELTEEESQLTDDESRFTPQRPRKLPFRSRATYAYGSQSYQDGSQSYQDGSQSYQDGSQSTTGYTDVEDAKSVDTSRSKSYTGPESRLTFSRFINNNGTEIYNMGRDIQQEDIGKGQGIPQGQSIPQGQGIQLSEDEANIKLIQEYYDIYPQLVKSITASFIQQINNTCVFNFFGYITDSLNLFTGAPATDTPTLILNSIINGNNSGLNPIEFWTFFAYLSIAPGYIVPNRRYPEDNSDNDIRTPDEILADDMNALYSQLVDDGSFAMLFPEGIIIPELQKPFFIKEYDAIETNSENDKREFNEILYNLADQFAVYLLRKYDSNIPEGLAGIESLFQDLTNFLDSSSVLQIDGKKARVSPVVIAMNPFFQPVEDDGTTMKAGQKGGEEPSLESANNVEPRLRALINEKEREGVLQAKAIVDFFKPHEEEQEYATTFNEYKENLKQYIGDVLESDQQLPEPERTKLLKPLFSVIDNFTLPQRNFTTTQANTSYNTRFWSNTNVEKPLIKILKRYDTVLKEESKRVEKEQAQAKALEEAAKKAERRAERGEQEEGGKDIGELEPIRETFLKTVAKIGLFMNGITEGSVEGLGPQVTQILTGVGTMDAGPKKDFLIDLLGVELGILFYYADFIQPVKIGDVTISPKGKRDLDTKLTDVVKNHLYADTGMGDYDIENGGGGRYFCNDDVEQNKYMIDNAAILPATDKQNNTFCPLTSIIDGMNQCTLGSIGSYDATTIELGDMGFQVYNEGDINAYYKGKLTITDDTSIPGENTSTPGTLRMLCTYQVELKGFNNAVPQVIARKEDIEIKDGKIKALEAYNALRITLTSLLKIIIGEIQGSRADPANHPFGDYFASSNSTSILDRIINIVTSNEITIPVLEPYNIQTGDINDPGSLRSNLFQSVFSILLKGAGDVFQEINSVCKYGGYTGAINYIGNIHGWNAEGDAMRCFAANDRVSADRFIFLLLFGQDAQINKYAFGGFIGKAQDIIAFKPIQQTIKGKTSNMKVCEYGEAAGPPYTRRWQPYRYPTVRPSGGTRRKTSTNKSKKRYIQKQNKHTKRNKSRNHKRNSKKIKRGNGRKKHSRKA